jgi:hypothetical protein
VHLHAGKHQAFPQRIYVLPGVNPDVLSVDGDGKLCTFNVGRPIGMGSLYAVKFSYAWRSEISFKPRLLHI